MQELDFERLRTIGLTTAIAQSLLNFSSSIASAGDSGGRAMRVTEVHRETVRVHDGAVEHSARVLPQLARGLIDDDDAIAVGDWVLAEMDAHAELWLTARMPPVTALARRDGDGHRHVVVSNVDTALLVMGLDGDFNARRLERFLAIVQGSGVWPVVVLSKADLCADVERAVAQLRERLPREIGIHALDTQSASAAEVLAPYMGAGQTVVLLGSSGAGKSTLTNTLIGAQVQDTGGVRSGDSRGRHTTTARSLHRLGGGACVIDTPGVRTLRPDGDAASLLDAAFADIATLAAQCRFRDCSHRGEPGCAVRAGVPADRLHNFHKLQREMRRDTLTLLERRQQLSEWKARGRAARVHIKAKRGE